MDKQQIEALLDKWNELYEKEGDFVIVELVDMADKAIPKLTAQCLKLMDEVERLREDIHCLLHPACSCWKCMGLEKDPYGEDREGGA